LANGNYGEPPFRLNRLLKKSVTPLPSAGEGRVTNPPKLCIVQSEGWMRGFIKSSESLNAL
jgi:hypothetical protein